jgi:phage/plasmid-associated DNA primase
MKISSTWLGEDGLPTEVKLPPKPVKKARKGKKARAVELSDYEIAEDILQTWRNTLAYQAGSFFSLSTEGWQDVTGELSNLANKFAGRNTSNSVMPIIQGLTAIPSVTTDAVFYWEKIEKEWVPFKAGSKQVVFCNGILDLDRMVFEEDADRAIYGAVINLPYEIDSLDATDSIFENMVNRAFPILEQREYFQRLCGLILMPHVIFRGQIVLWGSPHTGKSTIARAIALAPGGFAGASFLTEEAICSNKYARVNLVNKFANVSDDSHFSNKWESWFKQYTGGIVEIEPKFCKVSTVPATAKIISTCNEFQTLKDLSGAAEMRYRVFRMDNAIPVSGSIEQTQFLSPEYWCQKDKRKGVMGWLLRGLKKAIDKGILEPESLAQIKKDAITSTSPVKTWISENTIEDASKAVLTNDILARMALDNIPSTSSEINRVIKYFYPRAIPYRTAKSRGFKGVDFIE